MVCGLGLGILPPPHKYLALRTGQKMIPVGNAQQQTFGGYIDGDGGGAGKNKVEKVGTRHIQQSTMAGGSDGNQWGGGADGRR